MAKLNDKQRKEVIAYFLECQNYSETGRKFHLADNSVRAIVKKDKDLSKKLDQKMQENTEDVLEAMKKRSMTKINLLDKIFKAMDGKLENIDMFTNIKDLATAYGIIMDKELKLMELNLKAKELENPKESTIHRIEIINDLPKGDEDGNN